MSKNFKLGFVGLGNMATAILSGILKEKIVAPSQIMVFDSLDSKREQAKAMGIVFASSNQMLADSCEYILFAIKPQMFSDAVKGVIFSDNILISIMAGVKKQKISSATACPVVRIMPNTPAMIGKGISAIDASEVSKDLGEFVFQIFGAVGDTVSVCEADMDAVTAVSGSGPAYMYLFIDALSKAGVRLGLEADVAKKLAIQTMIGSAELAKSSSEPLDVLLDRVCSKGGTTIEAVKVFCAENRLYELTDEAVEACAKRSRELSAI